MLRNLCSAALVAALLASAANAQPGIAGRWVQSSSGQELVLRPKIKLTPYAAPGYGTNLGGSVGYGSATTTVVTTEATPMKVDRDMVLEVAADGTFTWQVIKREAGATCLRTVKQDRHGRATVSSGELVLSIEGGRESSDGSCGGEGAGAMPAVTERYRMSLSGGELVLSSGSVRWRFRRG
ncbi:MAG TPA: hypothetical protein VEY69_08705 [Lautropia sp.]|nr:hypothetical protein [Lautropia sp.]